jgi:hypothetical protein
MAGYLGVNNRPVPDAALDTDGRRAAMGRQVEPNPVA